MTFSKLIQCQSHYSDFQVLWASLDMPGHSGVLQGTAVLPIGIPPPGIIWTVSGHLWINLRNRVTKGQADIDEICLHSWEV